MRYYLVVKRKPPVIEYDGKTPLPDPKQELFCVLYTSNSTPKFFGNGKWSYAFAYGYQEGLNKLQENLPIASTLKGKGKSKKKFSDYSKAEAEIKRIENVCAACATRLLINANVKLRCNYLMDQLAAHTIVDRELLFVIEQRHDLQSKVQAIKHHDQREARIRQKVDLTHDFEPIDTIQYMKPA